MMHVHVAVSLLFALITAHGAAAFEYKGVPLGVTEKDFRRSHPSFTCGQSDNDFSDRTCVQPAGTYANVPVKFTKAFFEADKLCSVLVLVSYDHYLTVSNALREAYGTPSKGERVALPASAAPHTANWIHTWRKERFLIELRSYAYGWQSTVELKNDACLDGKEARQKDRAKRRSKDL